MPLNTFTVGITIGDLPEFCGPRDLSDAIISLRESNLEQYGGDRNWLAPISNDGVRRLINLAYYTSLAAEEGRYPRFRLMSAEHGKNSIWYAADFDAPISDVESLRRLAPSVSDIDGALLITEHDSTLHCTGSVIVSDLGFGTKIGRPEIVGIGQSPSLIVRIDGPGRLRATESVGVTLILDHGRIQQIVDYWLVTQVKKLWEQLADQMIDKTASTHGEETREYFGGSFSLAQVIHKAWSRVLATAIDKRHGGAFVVIPTLGDPEDYDIRCKYSTQMRFGEDILQFWQICVSHATVDDEHEREKLTNAWNWRRETVFAKAEILAGLSSVDGCVVLDRNLQVLGFGGEIRVDDEKAEKAPRALKNINTGQLMEDELKQLGTRHRSAYRLAKVHPGIIVFVISQDGDLRIFCSDENNVRGFDRLHAWVHQHESV